MLNRMKKHFVLAAAASVVMAGSANAEMVAGWDFSQYGGENIMTTDQSFSTYVNALSANYSDLDTSGATIGAGSGSEAFGTAYFDGTNGSTDVTETGFVNGDLTPVSGSLSSNSTAPAALSFDSFTALGSDGQLNTNALRMTLPPGGLSSVNIVFEADLTSTSEGAGEAFSIAFAGITFSGTSTVTVEFASSENAPGDPDFALVDSKTLTSVDTRFETFVTPSIQASKGWFRLNINTAGGQAAIDNVSINATLVPEPATALMMMAGLVGLGINSRRRS